MHAVLQQQLQAIRHTLARSFIQGTSKHHNAACQSLLHAAEMISFAIKITHACTTTALQAEQEVQWLDDRTWRVE